MMTIYADSIDGVVKPKIAIPDNAMAVVFDGEKYIIYQAGDKLPDTAEG